MSSSFSSVSSPASAVQPRTASLVWPPHHAISPHFIRAVVGHLSPQHAFLRSPVCQPLWRTLVCPDLESCQQFPIVLICRNPLESWFHHSLCQCSLFIHRSSSTHQTPLCVGQPAQGALMQIAQSDLRGKASVYRRVILSPFYMQETDSAEAQCLFLCYYFVWVLQRSASSCL